MKIAGVVVLYHPTKEDINNIDSYISELDKLYVIDNTEDVDNTKTSSSQQRLASPMIKIFFQLAGA